MKFDEQELNFIRSNHPIIKKILEKKYSDIIDELILEKDPIKTEVLKLWATETKQLVVVLDGLMKKKLDKEKGNTTGI